MRKGKIFVQIAAYRDPELVATIEDCLSQAKYPKNLVFSICWQHDSSDLWDNLDKFKKNPRFKIIDVDIKDSQGVCWARNLLQQQYSDEEYTLQLDSHHRFVKDWDEILINMYKDLRKKGHKKPLITCYLPSYFPEKDPEARIKEPWKLVFDRFLPQGAVFPKPHTIDNYRFLREPIAARFYSAHFAFTSGRFVQEVPHDPELYFHGEEISIAVRAFTHGYDLFHPHVVLAWHEYERATKKKHWSDHSWDKRNAHSHERVRRLLGIDGIKREDLGIYGLGTSRTLEDYEKYAGIHFRSRKIQQYTLDARIPPNPIYCNPMEYQVSFIDHTKYCIDIPLTHFKEKDYDCWVVSFEKSNGEVIYRQDCSVDELKSLLKGGESDGIVRIWREYYGIKPDKWVVWPHSLNKGWVERIEGVYGYE